MEQPAFDVTNCDREPIHIPGKIQNHGFLVAVDKSNGTIGYASDNLKQKTGLHTEHILGQSFEWFLQKSRITLTSFSPAEILSFNRFTNFEAINPVLAEVHGVPHHLIFHAAGNDVLLAEFEPGDSAAESDLHRLIGVSVSRILEGKTAAETLENTACQVREIIQFDRVMIYKFWDDGHGEVIAENKREDLEPFFGLHYPATDIPRQARDLYLTNLTRLLSDVSADTSSLLAQAKASGEAPAPLDLTHSTLRAVSPVHIQYLKNMGVAASFSASLVIKGKLWGLIACHNETPKFIDYRAREAAKLLGRILSSSVERRSDEEAEKATSAFRQSTEVFAKQLYQDQNIAETFAKNKTLVWQATHATGSAVIFENKICMVGQTPADEQIKGIVNWLKKNVTSPIFYTENLSQHYAAAQPFASVASGLLACELSKEMNEYILWFKPELVTMVSWAGNPNKPMETEENGTVTLTPRHSFDVWKEQVKNTSAAWLEGEVSSAQKLREEVIYSINQKANQIRLLNDKLKEAYDELDTFSFTISHDLKTPITSIRNYTEIILEENEKLDNDTILMLKRILKGTDKMSLLIKEVLSYSRISREEMRYEETDMNQMVHDIVTELKSVYNKKNTLVSVGNLPRLLADKTMMMQVFTNVIGNAIKYSQQAAAPHIAIDGSVNGNNLLYKISDNGIRIDMSFGNQIFEIFKRLNNVAQFEGSGVGLSIVKRIMEKHGARVWYESEVNVGTTFYLFFLNNNVVS